MLPAQSGTERLRSPEHCRLRRPAGNMRPRPRPQPPRLGLSAQRRMVAVACGGQPAAPASSRAAECQSLASRRHASCASRVSLTSISPPDPANLEAPPRACAAVGASTHASGNLTGAAHS